MADMFDKFTERARRVLTLAKEEATSLNHNYIGTEHLLLGLVAEGDGVATRVLANLGVRLPKVREAIRFIIRRGEGTVIGETGLTPRAKKVIELAVDEARRLNHHYIGTEHLLLGLMREGKGIAAGVLESLGVSLEQVRTQVMQVVNGGRLARPSFGALVRVVPVGQVQVDRGVEASLLTLEVYEAGFLITVRLRFMQQPECDGLTVSGQISARDEQGTIYQVAMEQDRRTTVGEWRFTTRFMPSLPADGERLQIEVPAVHGWEGREQVLKGSVTEHQAGPWIFTLALPRED